jgi:hypothetical protein
VRGKGSGERAVLLVAAKPLDLVQRAPCEPAIRQNPVDLVDAEGQDPMRRRCRPLDPPDPFPELKKKGPFRAGHARNTSC